MFTYLTLLRMALISILYEKQQECLYQNAFLFEFLLFVTIDVGGFVLKFLAQIRNI